MVPIVESTKHLGILLQSGSSSISRTNLAISSSRGAYYALAAVGARHSCINPCTSILLYKAMSLPILTFGLDIVTPSNSEFTMMERSQSRILRTILGLPIHVRIDGMHVLLGTIPIRLVAAMKQLTFIRNTLALPVQATPRKILLSRASSRCCPSGSIVNSYINLLDSLCLPSISSLSSDTPSKLAWKALVKTVIHESFRDEVTNSVLYADSLFSGKYGHLSPILHEFSHNLALARLSSLRIRLLMKASSLNAHTSNFRAVVPRVRSPICSLCSLGCVEDAVHFISICPALKPIRDMWLPKIYASSVPPPETVCAHVLGLLWCDDIQATLLKFLADLYSYRALL